MGYSIALGEFLVLRKRKQREEGQTPHGEASSNAPVIRALKLRRIKYKGTKHAREI
jgi:hypothetical protein